MKRIKRFLKSSWFAWAIVFGLATGVAIGENRTWHREQR